MAFFWGTNDRSQIHSGPDEVFRVWQYNYQLLRYFLLGRDRERTVNFSNHLQVNDLVGRQQVCHYYHTGEGVSGNNDDHCCIFCFLSDLVGRGSKNSDFRSVILFA